MKAVLVSIRPKWCEKIISGEKTIEVRKTRPKLNPPFRCYIYCTKAMERLICILRDGDENYGEIYHGKTVFIKTDEGSICDTWGKRQKVFGEFTCDRIDEYDDDTIFSFQHEDYARWNDFDLDRACMHPEDFQNYANGKWLYGWHISDLRVYDHPRDLWEFTGLRETKFGWAPGPITRPPQSWRYVEEEIWNDWSD